MPNRGNEADRKSAQLSMVARVNPNGAPVIEGKDNRGSSEDVPPEPPGNISFFHSGRLIRFAIDDKTDHIQRYILQQERFYEEQMLLDIARRLDRPGPIFDVGANIGNHSIFFGLVCDRRVIAIEPQDLNFARLVANVELNKLGGKVRCLQAAAGARPGRGKAIVCDAHNLGTTSIQVSNNAADIEILTLDGLARDEPPALIKIDVEGMEFDVLKGAAELLRAHDPLLYVEVTNKIHYDKISDWLAELGYHQGLIFNATPTILYFKGAAIADLNLTRAYGYLAIDHMHARESHSLKRREIEKNRDELATRSFKIDGLAAQLQEQNARKIELESELAARDAELMALSAKLSAQTSASEQTALTWDRQISELMAKLERSETVNSEQDKGMSELRARLAEFEAGNLKLEQARVVGQADVKALEAGLKAQTLRATNLEKKLASRDREIRKLKKSSSWRITKPLRVVTRGLREFLRLVRYRLAFFRQLLSERLAAMGHNWLPTSFSRPAHVQPVIRPHKPKKEPPAARPESDSAADKVSVVMTTYNSASYVVEAIRSILEQTYRNLELIIVDDASTDNTFELLQQYARADKRVRVYKTFENRGTYWCKNFGITKATGGYVTAQDSDDVSDLDRLRAQIEALSAAPDAVVATCNYVRRDSNGHLVENRGKIERLALIAMMFKRTAVFDKVGYFDSVRTSADAELWDRLRIVFGRKCSRHIDRPLYTAFHREGSLTTGVSRVDLSVSEKPGDLSFLSPDRAAYVHAYRDWHNALEKGNASPYMPFPLVCRHFAAPESMLAVHQPKEECVTASVASFPSRKESLRQTVASILPQVHRLNVYLNNYEAVPAFLQHPKITIARSQDHGDLRDNGKFFFLDFVAEGYHFTIDDDIIYAPNYVQHLILKIQQYRKQAIVGVHGVVLAHPIERFYKDRTVAVFSERQDSDKVVNLLGTGTTAYHTSALKLAFTDFQATGMADLWLGVMARRQKVPMISVTRGAKWLVPAQGSDAGLYEEFRNNDEFQTFIARQEGEWDFHTLREIYQPLAEYLTSKSPPPALTALDVDVAWWESFAGVAHHRSYLDGASRPDNGACGPIRERQDDGL